MNVLSFERVGFAYPGYMPVLNDFSAELRQGEILCVIGPSGCGKTTLLNLAGGFLIPDSGIIADRQGGVSGPCRNRIMVFQDSSQLFPWLKTADNVKFPLKHSGESAEDISKRVGELLAMVGLSEAADLYPSQLSGGMKQRAVIARALSTRPDMLLLDEPFTALDAPTRRGLQDMLLNLKRSLGVSMLFVTHDIREAVYLADRLLVIKDKKKSGRFLEEIPGLKNFRDERDEFSDEFVRLERKVYSAVKDK